MLPGNRYSFAALRNKLKIKREMKKILKINEAIKIANKFRAQNKTVVVAGGFFDILHTGHIEFLEKSKKYGGYLFVLLEDDKKAREIKGTNRPINSQKNRAKILSSLQSIDYVVLLKNMTNNAKYDRIIVQMRPNVLATTYGDPYIKHKKRQAKLISGKVICVISRIYNHSTTKLTKHL